MLCAVCCVLCARKACPKTEQSAAPGVGRTLIKRLRQQPGALGWCSCNRKLDEPAGSSGPQMMPGCVTAKWQSNGFANSCCIECKSLRQTAISWGSMLISLSKRQICLTVYHFTRALCSLLSLFISQRRISSFYLWKLLSDTFTRQNKKPSKLWLIYLYRIHKFNSG